MLIHTFLYTLAWASIRLQDLLSYLADLFLNARSASFLRSFCQRCLVHLYYFFLWLMDINLQEIFILADLALLFVRLELLHLQALPLGSLILLLNIKSRA